MSQHNIVYRMLTDADVDAVYRAFLVAFSDYQVNMKVSPDQFRERLVRDGVQMQVSAAAFVNDEIVGFYINGLGDWNGKLTAYDAGTGVIPNYRCHGIGQRLFQFLLPQLQSSGAKRYLLEVITHNSPAVNLYRKLGFHETRTFGVFRANELHLRAADEGKIKVRPVPDPDWQLYQSFWDAEPSWQNSIQAIKRIQGITKTFGAFLDNECIGYGVLQSSTGNVMQLAVSSAHRRKRLGSAILSALQAALNPSERLKVTNVDVRMRGVLAFYERAGFTRVLDQFEMMKEL